MTGYHALANAIIEQAAQDYRNALKACGGIRIPKRRWKKR